ncbi:GNAT family N-acetyltransferase [Sulfurimonas sp.]|uniref:GNAT family N-acetyltransferase n=1 Tax=Sulfurimonas sp. TaxID=2022749 RepID=UPI002AB1341E|nr:GNAT family N-acetyltransferase [Sulfurimonas sp.]
MPKPTLYFLRSSENKIAKDILHYAMRLDTLNKTVQDFSELDIYYKFYGLSSKDLGLYALDNNTIAGAVWIRLLKKEDKANAFIDADTPVLQIAVKPELRNKGIGFAMMEQFFIEAAASFEQISLSVVKDSDAIRFYEKFGFSKVEGLDALSIVDDKPVITMLKKLIKKEIVRPSDGYDPRKWMD